MCAVQPWYIDTPLAAPVIQNPKRLGEVCSRTPMDRVGQPGEVSGDSHISLWHSVSGKFHHPTQKAVTALVQ